MCCGWAEHGRRVSWAVKEMMDEDKKQQDSLAFLHGIDSPKKLCQKKLCPKVSNVF